MASCGLLCEDGNASLNFGCVEYPRTGTASRFTPRVVSVVPSTPTRTCASATSCPSKQCAAVRMRVGEISVPVHRPPSQAMYGACAIGTVAPPDTAWAGAAASAVMSIARSSRARIVRQRRWRAPRLSALNFAAAPPEVDLPNGTMRSSPPLLDCLPRMTTTEPQPRRLGFVMGALLLVMLL